MDYTGRMWTITLPAGTPLLSMNDRRHHMAQAAATRQLMDTFRWLIRQQHIPHLERVHIVFYLLQPDQRRRDPANWMATAKVGADALVREKVLADDDHRHVTGPDPRLVTGTPSPLKFVLRIRELET